MRVACKSHVPLGPFALIICKFCICLFNKHKRPYHGLITAAWLYAISAIHWFRLKRKFIGRTVRRNASSRLQRVHVWKPCTCKYFHRVSSGLTSRLMRVRFVTLECHPSTRIGAHWGCWLEVWDLKFETWSSRLEQSENVYSKTSSLEVAG